MTRNPNRYPIYVVDPWPGSRRAMTSWGSNGRAIEIAVIHDGHPNGSEVVVYSGTLEDRIGGNDDDEMFAQGLWAHPGLEPREVASFPGAWPEWVDLAVTMHRELVFLTIDNREIQCDGVSGGERWFAQARFADHQVRVSARGTDVAGIQLVADQTIAAKLLGSGAVPT